MRLAVLALAMLLAFAATPAFAQDADPAVDVNKDRVTLGVGVATLPDYEGSNDMRWSPLPAAQGTVGGYSFTLLGTRASVDLIRNTPGPGWDFQAGPIAVLNLNRTSTKGIHDPRVKALGKVGTAVEVGGYVGIGRTGVITSDYDMLSVSVSYRYDVAGAHKSGIITPSITYMTPLSRKAMVSLFASADIVERGYGRTYFSVTPAGSIASGLPVYTAGGGFKNFTLGGFAAYSLTGDLLHGLSLVAGGTYRKLQGDFADSPVTSVAGSADQWIGTVGLAYTF